MNRSVIAESTAFAQAATPAEGTGRLRVRIINEGVGSSGAYPRETLEAAAVANVFHKGLHVYLDHPSVTESYDRPERSVKDLAGALATDAVYESGALYADLEVFSTWRAAISEMADTIGLSIRASAVVEDGEYAGQQLPVVKEIAEAYSVDFVTKAGRGGRVMEVIESARATTRAVARGVAEATVNDRREQLNALVKDAHGDADNKWVWVRDFDDTTVWFEIETNDDMGIYAQGYELTDDVATALTGDRVEVRVRTEYVPVTTPTPATEAAPSVPSRPAGQSTANESKEDTMATTQIEESRLAQLETDAGRATALETELTEARRERDEARQEVTESHREADTATAQAVIAAADYEFNDLEQAGLMANLPLVAESGRLDRDAFTTRVTEAAATAAEAAGAGTVRGLGANRTAQESGDLSIEEMDAELARISGRTVKEA
ncbi:hypothetical protein [Occultella kanbiaonis]|uniref:hypothetical protein n=1 Tax=Occultella kanbiaonis TaxID=2675754 RepID=UPI0013D87C3E|nr:hypothetical protein [Occultella kanbiaonis]